MELVDLMYRYINKFIGCDDLLAEFGNIDLTKYRVEEIASIEKIIRSIEKVCDSVPNECDEIELQRRNHLENLLAMFESTLSKMDVDDENCAFLKEQQARLVKEKSKQRDGGKRYAAIFEILTQNDLIGKYAKAMDTRELLDFITKYISVPVPPNIEQEVFDALVDVGIRDDAREKLWRLASNYEYSSFDFSRIVSYFIEKRDAYYLGELLGFIDSHVDREGLIADILQTKDGSFISALIESVGDKFFSNDEILKMRKKV